MHEKNDDTVGYIIETDRLLLRELTPKDAAFIHELVNEPAWIRYIGDRGIRTESDAVFYISNGPGASYKRFNFGLYLVELKESKIPIGICGLIKRDAFEDVEIGFAFLQRFWSKGYAFESACGVMDFARDTLKLKRIIAITVPDNQASIKILEKLGLKFEKIFEMPGEETEIKIFAIDIDSY